MFIAVPCRVATLSPTLKPQDPRLVLRRLLLLCSLVFGLNGCHSHPVASAATITPARSLTGPSSAVMQVQSSPLYQQARQDCKRGDYTHAAQLLESLAKTPGLAPDAIAFCKTQQKIAQKDAGLPVASPVLTSLPAHTPTDADCGPRALLIVCQKLGVKTNLETLRKTAGTTADGTTLAGLQQAAQKLGLKAEGVQVSREALSDIQLPALAWDRRQHFIVVQGLEGHGDSGVAQISDPNKSSEETISQESLLQRSGGVLLLVHR